MSNGPVQASAFDVGEWQRLTQKRDALMGELLSMVEVPPKHRALVAQLSGELESVQNQLDEQSNAVAKEMTTQQENHRQVVQGLQAELALERSKGELAAKLEPKTNAAQAEALKIAQEKIIEVVNALRRKSSAPRIDTWEPRQLQLTPKDPNFPASPIGLQSPPEASASSQEVDDIRADISPRPTSQPSAVPKEATATTNAQPRPADSDVVPALPTPVLEKLESPTMGEAPAPPLAEPPVAQEALPVVEAPVVEVPVDPVAEAPVAAAAGPPAAPETVAVAGTKGAEAPETVVAGTKGAEAPESPLVTLLCALMFNKLTIPDAFPILDRKKTGALEYGDVEEVAQTFALADTSRLFKALDVDGDGKVSLDDWTAALSSVDPEIGRAALRARGVSDAS